MHPLLIFMYVLQFSLILEKSIGDATYKIPSLTLVFVQNVQLLPMLFLLEHIIFQQSSSLEKKKSLFIPAEFAAKLFCLFEILQVMICLSLLQRIKRKKHNSFLFGNYSLMALLCKVYFSIGISL